VKEIVSPRIWARFKVLDFDQLIEVFWRLKVYPFLISKKKLKFFFLYSRTGQKGLTISDTADVLMWIALQSA
jgi:hypothetical protein